MNPAQKDWFNKIQNGIRREIERCITQILKAMRDSDAREIFQNNSVNLAFVDKTPREQADALLQFYEAYFPRMHTAFVAALTRYEFNALVNQLNQLSTMEGAFNVPAKSEANDKRMQTQVIRGSLQTQHENVIKQNFTYLLENIDAKHLTSQLYARNIITSKNRKKIESIGDKEKRTRKLLDKILNAGADRAFFEFLDALRNTYYPLIADKIESDLENNLKN